MKRNHSKRKQNKSRNVNQQFNLLLDRSLALSDGSVTSTQDKFELKSKSNRPPSTVPRSLANQSYWARLSQAPSTFSTSTTVNTYAAFYFALNTFAQYADYTSVFDQYCIVEAVVRIVPDLQASLNTTLSTLITAIDHDDATAPTSVAQVQAHTTCLQTVNMAQTRLVKPRMAVSAYGSGFGSYMNTTGYLDSGTPDVQHYGLKLAALPTGNVFTYTLFFEIVVHFRDNI